MLGRKTTTVDELRPRGDHIHLDVNCQVLMVVPAKNRPSIYEPDPRTRDVLVIKRTVDQSVLFLEVPQKFLLTILGCLDSAQIRRVLAGAIGDQGGTGTEKLQGTSGTKIST